MENKQKKWNWKNVIQGGKGKKEQWLIIVLVGLLLLVIAVPTSKEESGDGNDEDTYKTDTNADSGTYARQLETRLEQALTQVRGVGKVSVMITLSSSGEKVVEKDKETSTDRSEGSESGTSQSSSSSETSVYSGGSSSENPYVKKELSPDIEGVIVIADGGDNAVIIENITEAVQALFGVDTHKIKVMKRNS